MDDDPRATVRPTGVDEPMMIRPHPAATDTVTDDEEESADRGAVHLHAG
jgi:hypothetical protein